MLQALARRGAAALVSFSALLGVHLGASPIAVAADLATIQERGYLIVAVKDNWRPLGFVDGQGNLTGFEIAIASRLAEVILGDATAVEFYPVANRDRIPALLADEVDVAIAGISITPMRQRIVEFSQPYYLDSTAFIVRDISIYTLADLRTADIGLIEGSDAVPTVHYTLPLANLVGVASYQAGKEALETRQLQAIAGDVTVLTGWVQAHPEYRLLPDLLTAEPLAVATPKGNQYRSLQQLIDASINEWHANGWLEEQATLWGLP